MLRITALFQDALSLASFGCFVLLMSDDLQTREEWIKFYEKAIKAYSYYTLLPCIAKVAHEEIERDPILREFFHSWSDYMIVRNKVIEEEETPPDAVETIVTFFTEAFGPIGKFFFEATGSLFSWLRDILGSASHQIWQMVKKKNYDLVYLCDVFIQRYRDIGNRMRIRNLPEEIYYQQRPTLDFDLVTLFSHIHALHVYKILLAEAIQAQVYKPLSKKLKARIFIDGELYKEMPLDEAMKIHFCLPRMIEEQFKGKTLTVEVG